MRVGMRQLSAAPALAACLLLACDTSGCDERPRSLDVDLSSKGSLGAKSIYAGVGDYHDHPLGGSRQVVRYTWELYFGHATESVRLHFKELKLSPGDELRISNAANERLQTFVFFPAATPPLWTETFSTNLVKIELVYNQQVLSTGAPDDDHFTIDRVEWKPTLERWLGNDPTTQLNAFGTHPNVHVLQVANLDMRNREVWAVVEGGGANHYYASSWVGHRFDFATIPDRGTTNEAFSAPRDVWMADDDAGVAAGNLGGDARDDIVHVSRNGDVHVSVARSTAAGVRFDAYTLAHRTFTSGTASFAVGNMDTDGRADVLAIEDARVRWAPTTGTSDVPQLGAVVDVSVPDTYGESGVGRRRLIGDFNADGYVDFASSVNTADTGAPPWGVDHLHLYLNDRAGAFTSHHVQGSAGFGNLLLDGSRSTVGDFNGDGYADLAAVDTSSGAWSLKIAFNLRRATPASPAPASIMMAFTSPQATSLPAIDGMFIMGLRAVDLDADGLDDLVATVATAGMGVLGGTREARLIVALARKRPASPLASERIELVVEDWTPAEGLVNAPSLMTARIGSQGRSGTIVDTAGLRGRINVFANGLSSTPADHHFKAASDWLSARPRYAIGDVDQDGRPDVIEFTADRQGSVEVFRNQSATPGVGAQARFKRDDHPWLTSFARDFRANAEVPLVGDVNGDRLADLVLFARSPTFAIDNAPITSGVFVAKNNGDGTFAAPVRWHSLFGLSLDETHLPAVGDFNRDGKDDIGLFVQSNASAGFNIAFSYGSGFGGSSGIDVAGGPFWGFGSTPRYSLQTADGDGDGRDEVFVSQQFASSATASAGNLERFRLNGSSIESEHVFGFGEPVPLGRIQPRIGTFTGRRRADVALWLQSSGSQGAVKMMFADELGELGELLGVYHHVPAPLLELATFAGDIDADNRDELLIVRLENTGLRFLGLDIGYADIDLYARPAPTPASQIPPTSWTWRSTRRFVGEEMIAQKKSDTGAFFARVQNSGVSALAYKLVADRGSEIDLDLLWVPNALPTSYTPELRGLLEDSAPRFRDAFDGQHILRRISAFVPRDKESLKDWRGEACDTFYPCDYDVIVVEKASRAHAKDGCAMWLFLDEGDDFCDQDDGEWGGDNGGTFVHEYGHYGFDLEDEYCEGEDECGFDPDGRTSALCPNSLMAKSSQREFCTEHFHRPYGITDQENACWSDIGPFPTNFTPNPHAYDEFMFQNRFHVYSGNTDVQLP